MNARALLALAGAVLWLCACGYDYQDRNAALDRLPAVESGPSCRSGESLETVKTPSIHDVLASPGSFAEGNVRLRGTFRHTGDGGEKLVAGGDEIALDLAPIPPFLIERCPNQLVDVDGTVTAGGAEKKPLLRALVVAGVTP